MIFVLLEITIINNKFHFYGTQYIGGTFIISEFATHL